MPSIGDTLRPRDKKLSQTKRKKRSDDGSSGPDLREERVERKGNEAAAQKIIIFMQLYLGYESVFFLQTNKQYGQPDH